MKNILYSIIIFVCLISNAFLARAQETIAPLFPYPEVPEDVKDVKMRADFMIEHLWEVCDLEKNDIDNVDSFRETFTDYLSFFVLADVEVVQKSVENFIKRVSKNETNLGHVMEFVDSEIYRPFSQFNSDDLYILFANNFLKSKKVSKEQKKVYTENIEKLSVSRMEAVFPNLEVSRDGNKITLHSLQSEFTIVFFNTADCFDCEMYKLRLSADIATNRLIENNIINVVSIFEANDQNAVETMANESKNWYTTTVESMEEQFDMRILPCVYVLDKDKKIIAKSPKIVDLLNMMAQIANAKGV